MAVLKHSTPNARAITGGAFDLGDLRAGAESALREAKLEAARIVAAARAEAERMRSEARAEGHAEGRAAGFSEGETAGRKAGEAAGRAEALAAHDASFKALEEAFGIRLFQRGIRKVTPTKDARAFADRSGAALHEIAEAANALTRRELAGEIALSIAPFYGNRIVLPRLANFHNVHSGLRVSPQMSSALAKFETDETDAALRYGAGEWKGLTTLLLHRDTLAAVATPEYVAGRSLPLKPAEIAAMTRG
jgi:hypothetical protein